MADDTGAANGAPREKGPQQEQSFGELFSAAVSKAGFATVTPGEMPSGRDLLAAVGGVRGIVESILPGFAFLVTYAVTSDLLLSVGIPVVVAATFIIWRLIARQPLRMAITGTVIAAATAALALFTGRASDQFVPGLIINSVWLTGLLISLAVRWPLIGLAVGALSGDLTGWRRDPAKRRVLTIATLFWVGLFALRIAVQAPLYFASLGDPSFTEPLAAAKLILGVPLYAMLLWVTWLFVGTVYGRPSSPSADTPDTSTTS